MIIPSCSLFIYLNIEQIFFDVHDDIKLWQPVIMYLPAWLHGAYISLLEIGTQKYLHSNTIKHQMETHYYPSSTHTVTFTFIICKVGSL